MEHLSSPFVSVIVPVFNDRDRLKICLEKLENQTYPNHLYEVVVVDNASDNGEEVKDLVARFARAIATYESFPSSFAARNQGISLAKGDIIAFTDADCIPALNWIEKGVKNLLFTPNCGLVAGKIEVFFKDSSKVTPVELYESLTAFPQKELIEKYNYAATANIFTFKDVIKRVGNFDARLKSSGDIEWGQRVAKFGYQQIYADEVCVAHPARYSFTQLFKRTVRLAGGMCDLYDKQSSSWLERNKMYAMGLVQNLVPPVNFWLKILFKSNLKSFNQKLQVCWVMFLVRYISAGETLRLKLGGSSTRD
ncbi:MAG: glycosyltransferase [Hydrococcus sp. Prado102]|jgi:glycosyltransferase involved in cell wall biosynthesis|nr:glycosyltransferase [Hydrococcus sp. Prado102]